MELRSDKHFLRLAAGACGCVILFFAFLGANTPAGTGGAATLACSPENVPALVALAPPETPPSTPPTTPPPAEPPPQECKYYYGELRRLGHKQTSVNAIVQDDGARNLSCLQRLVAQARNQSKNGAYQDDKIAEFISEQIFSDRDHKGRVIVGTHSNGAVCAEASPSAHLKGDCGSGYFYFDDSCRIVSAASVDELCGKMTVQYWESSPISLLWEPSHDIDASATIVSFSLDKVHAFSEWKGSKSAPLLVYDPDHSGQVESAAQLFGNWTFGGKASAGLRTSGLKAPSSSPWANGYEALGSLDRNGDGRVSGTEIEPLALWFDANRNAKVEHGELKTLAEAGVSALFYQPDSADRPTRSIFAQRGFERMVNGAAVTGASVDWYGAAGNSLLEVLSKHDALQLPKGERSTMHPDALGRSAQSETVNSERFAAINGVWTWSAEGEQNSAQGVFFLNSRDGQLTGASLTESYFVEGRVPATGRIAVFALQGALEAGSTGAVIGRFRLGQNGNETVSEFSLSPGGEELQGRSRAVAIKDGRRTSITYNWKARRAAD